MADQTRKIVADLDFIDITPFGVDMTRYLDSTSAPPEGTRTIVIGTVKVMANKYGIDTLIRAFSIVHEKLNENNHSADVKVVLRLVGDGPELSNLKKLTVKLGISEYVVFTGRVPHVEVPEQLEKMDIFVALSRLDSESFGVAAIEAGAASLPVIVSDAGGLPEVVIHGETGVVVPRNDPEAAAHAILNLINDAALRNKLGVQGRLHVQNNYAWDACVQTMVDVFEKTLKN